MEEAQPTWAKVIDQTRCIGCHACTTACKSENEVPLSVTRTFVKSVDVGRFPQVRRAFQVTRCNQCEDAPCVAACPTAAMYKRPDGIVDFDKRVCIGCKACMAACPYDAIFINPEDHSAEKCNLCAHRLDVGLEPACVVVCPVEAILVGDLNDPASKVAEIVQRDTVAVRRPEKETKPKLFYRGAHQATLDPLAAERPEGGLYMWSEQPEPAGRARAGTSMAAAIVSYDVAHSVPWDWRVSLYTWTKGIAAGAYLAALVACPGGPARVGELALALRSPAAGARLPRGDRRDPDRRSRAPAPLPPHLPATPVAELARPRSRRDHGVRRSPGARPGLIRGRCDQAAGVARDPGHPARGGGRRVHRLPVRAGQGARPLAVSASPAAPARPGRTARRRPSFCRSPTGSRRMRSARSSGYSADWRSSTWRWWRAR